MNPLLPITILILSWSLDTTDPSTQRTILYIFIAAHVLILAAGAYLFIAIWQRGDATLIRVKDSTTGEETMQKHWEYDMGKWRELMFTKIGLSAGVSGFVATRYGIPFPLLMQSLNNPRAVYDSELFRVYVRGHKAEGELARPWKEAGALPEWLQNIWNQSEATANEVEESANKASSGAAAAKAQRKRK